MTDGGQCNYLKLEPIYLLVCDSCSVTSFSSVALPFIATSRKTKGPFNTT